MRARNSVGYSVYSQVLTIFAATIPSQPDAPTTTVNSEYEIGVSWVLPTDQGGLTISSYLLEIMTSTGSFEKQLSNCDAENDSVIISGRSCTIPTAVLRQSPFLIGDSEPISTRVTAINDIGSSIVSSVGIATMPIADVSPDPPNSFIRNDASTTKTQIAFSWSAPMNDGGDTVVDYAIEMDTSNSGTFVEKASGVSSTSYT